MPRGKPEQPTPAELEILKVLWDHGALTVREALDKINQERPERAYTTVMTLLNVMAEKGLVKRTPRGRAFVYVAKAPREQTLGTMLGDLLGRAFEGSASALVAHLLDEANPSQEELDEIRRAISQYQNQQGAS